MPDAEGTHVQFVMAGVTEEMLTLPQALKSTIVASVKKAADIEIAEAGSPPIMREGLIPVRFSDKTFQVDAVCCPTE